MKPTKYEYIRVIQQNYGQGFEDVSCYKSNSKFENIEKSGKFITTKSGSQIEISLLKHDLKEYMYMGYPTRVINRRVKTSHYTISCG